LALLAAGTPPARAAQPITGAELVRPLAAGMPQADTAACLGCHSNPDLTKTLDNGEVLGLTIDGNEHARSVHGQANLTCVQCHTNIQGFPHPEFKAADRRDAALQLYSACQACHADQYQKANDSVHSRALVANKREAAICTDCHSAHSVRRLTNPATQQLLPDARIWIPQTCAKCHSAIYDKYKDSVHGKALIAASNLDVPTCIDCHGVHNIGDPTTAAFRLSSPSLCAKCHTNPAIMDKYGISTQVLNTYVADFHGTTVTLFEKTSPDAETNKPVCFNCHGVHDIRRVDDPQKGLEVRQNLLARCQVCHPGAASTFSEAWLSHYIPSQEKYPLVYFVNQFYQIFIPGVLGGMAVIVALDLSWRVRQRIRRRRPEARAPDQAVKPMTPRYGRSLPAQTDARGQATEPPAAAPSFEPPAPSDQTPEPPDSGKESSNG
ncbi:MAG TPA: hypothetical protein VJ754_11905, partial [Anaerolineae bacterium]|nr:hypothetical protein [Anaerolineae bacterium]